MFCVRVTNSFERDLKKLVKKNRCVTNVYESVIIALEKDPFGRSAGNTKIKKLTDVDSGKGGWRIRQGNYRVRYDVFGKDVVLHSFRDRKDAYR